MESPRPVPWPGSLVVKNGVKRCGSTASAIPAPESVTRMRTRSSTQVASSITRGRSGGFSDGLRRVVEQVDHHLLQRVAVAQHRGGGRQVLLDRDVLELEAVAHKEQRA